MHLTSRTVGAILLIAGSCIGAGMLAMPVVTGLAGFVPAVVAFVVCWLFMTTTGLLLLEVNIWLGEQISLVTMADRTLGRFGKWASWFLFCFLFYLILVSYIAGSGQLVSTFFEEVVGLALERWVGSFLFTLFFGILVYMGTRPVDWVNRFLMAGLIISYVFLIGLGVGHVRARYLMTSAPIYAVVALPIIVIAFGFHNMIPSITRYLRNNASRLRLSVIVGSTIPLLVYLLWEWIILGIVPREAFVKALGAGDIATETLRQVTGADWISTIAQYFAFFAIVTSFLAQALSLVHFLADGFKVRLSRVNSLLLTLLALVPPFVVAMIDPTIFNKALAIAGAYSAVILFGIFPALMVWVGRYREKGISFQIIPGGRLTLTVVIIFASCVIVIQVLNQLDLLGVV